MNYSKGYMEWFDCSISLCSPGGLNLTEFDAMEDMCWPQHRYLHNMHIAQCNLHIAQFFVQYGFRIYILLI
jgi:hypothetical protein